jgi:hypothetical protein
MNDKYFNEKTEEIIDLVLNELKNPIRNWDAISKTIHTKLREVAKDAVAEWEIHDDTIYLKLKGNMK